MAKSIAVKEVKEEALEKLLWRAAECKYVELPTRAGYSTPAAAAAACSCSRSKFVEEHPQVKGNNLVPLARVAV